MFALGRKTNPILVPVTTSQVNWSNKLEFPGNSKVFPSDKAQRFDFPILPDISTIKQLHKLATWRSCIVAPYFLNNNLVVNVLASYPLGKQSANLLVLSTYQRQGLRRHNPIALRATEPGSDPDLVE
jgi:hypothetical protein